MKLVILAGGLGSRISEESAFRPKPMIEIGGKPIIWHLMKIYSYYGINEFIICCGYKGHLIKEYFANYFLYMSDITFEIQKNSMEVHHRYSEPWKVTLVDTGEYTMTGGRLKRIYNYIRDEENFCFTYGDGLSDINILDLISFHKKMGLLATISAVYPSGRFGALDIHLNKVITFNEKPKGDGGLINGGFFVLSPSVLKLIKDDATIWEKDPLENLANNGQLASYEHTGFWYAMDTLRDKNYLENLWSSGNAPWKKW